jgi:hypothetical protein
VREREGESASLSSCVASCIVCWRPQAISLAADDSLCSVCTEEARLLGDGVCVDFDVSSSSSSGGGDADAVYKCSCNSSATGCVHTNRTSQVHYYLAGTDCD